MGVSARGGERAMRVRAMLEVAMKDGADGTVESVEADGGHSRWMRLHDEQVQFMLELTCPSRVGGERKEPYCC